MLAYSVFRIAASPHMTRREFGRSCSRSPNPAPPAILLRQARLGMKSAHCCRIASCYFAEHSKACDRGSPRRSAHTEGAPCERSTSPLRHSPMRTNSCPPPFSGLRFANGRPDTKPSDCNTIRKRLKSAIRQFVELETPLQRAVIDLLRAAPVSLEQERRCSVECSCREYLRLHLKGWTGNP